MTENTIDQTFLEHSIRWDGTLEGANEIVAWYGRIDKEAENPAYYKDGRIFFEVQEETLSISPGEQALVYTTLQRHRLDRMTS